MSSKAYEAVENALNAYLQEQSEEAVFSTGWVIVTEVSDFDNSRYVTITSDGLKYHSLIGLLSLAKRDAETIAEAAMMQQLFYTDEEDDDY